MQLTPINFSRKKEVSPQEILSDITVYMKYAKYLPEKKRRETWEELVTRNKQMQIENFPDLKKEIEEAYRMVYDKKVLPSMRSLQFSGKPIELAPSRIFNCAYTPVDHLAVFSEVMFLLLGGTGVGFSVQKHHIEKLPELKGVLPLEGRERPKRYLIGDSITGWSDAIKVLMESWFKGKKPVEFDYRDIRPKGERLITSGGKAPGPAPLRECITKITNILENVVSERGRGTKLVPIEVHDIICHIADAVLAGGIRRAALISLFSFDDMEMLTCKSGNWWESNPQRGRSNNSVVLVRSKVKRQDFFDIWKKVEESGAGEPGFFFTNDKDLGANPCLTGDTIVAVADGRNGVSIKELAEESNGEKTFPVYCGKPINYGNQHGESDKFSHWKTEIKDAVAFKSGNKEVIEIVLSDGSFFRCTPDHRLATKDGRWIEAKDTEGEQLEKFYSFSNKNSKKSYRTIQSISDGHSRQYRKIWEKNNGVLESGFTNVYYNQPIFVDSIIWTGEVEDVYDLTVKDNSNFYIITATDDENYLNSSGCLVHNCCEISLKPCQMCNLTEINASTIESQEDFNERTRVATFIGTLQAGYTDFHYLRPIWRKTVEKDALLGVSMTGIASEFVMNLDFKEAGSVAMEENERVAEIIGINKASRITSIKPSGSTSLVLGTSSGVHAWHNDYYIRRIRVGKTEAIYKYLSENHPELIEDEHFDPVHTAVISIPQKAPDGALLRNEPPIATLERVKKLHKEWIRSGHRKGTNTHNVSCTISVKENEWQEVGEWMWGNRDTYSGISVLPYDGGTYIQAPFEDITKEQYGEMVQILNSVDIKKIIEEEDETNLTGELACSGNGCQV